MVSLNQKPDGIMGLKIVLSNIHDTISLYNEEHLLRIIALLEYVILWRGEESA